MTKKNFKDNTPLDTVSRKEQSEVSKEEQQTTMKKKSNNDYMRLNIAGYRDYLSTMAGFEQMSITKYIQKLINADMENNKETYEEIKSIRPI